MKSGNTDKAEGKSKDAAGHIKEGVGKATNNEKLKAEGKKDQMRGHAQDAKGDLKKAVDK